MKKFLVGCVKFYQRLGTWVRAAQIPGVVYTPCRFQPTCSEYAILAIEKYGPWRGLQKAINRISRCHPLAAGGVDYP